MQHLYESVLWLLQVSLGSFVGVLSRLHGKVLRLSLDRHMDFLQVMLQSSKPRLQY